jgi:hypothetical protein
MKNSSDTIGNRYRDLPVCSAVPQPLHHRVPWCPNNTDIYIYIYIYVTIFFSCFMILFAPSSLICSSFRIWLIDGIGSVSWKPMTLRLIVSNSVWSHIKYFPLFWYSARWSVKRNYILPLVRSCTQDVIRSTGGGYIHIYKQIQKTPLWRHFVTNACKGFF